MKQKCMECGDEFVGRADKKFCSDQCRNTYNNRQNKDVNNYVRNVNYTLRKNRRILAELNPDNKVKIRKEKLIGKGFNFNFFTSMYRTKTGKEYFFCYEQGYLELEDNWLMLVVKREYLD